MPASFITAPAAEDLRWISAAVLVALAARGMGAGDSFTGATLRQWVPQLGKAGRAFGYAVHTLTRNDFITSNRQPPGPGGETVVLYSITRTGAEAIKAAASGALHRSGPKGPHSKDRAVPANTFAVRLWALMRARQVLDSETAAATLVDAGDDVAKATETARTYLARWACAGALTVSARRLPRGVKRYVLVKDSPTPPAWTTKAKARAARNSVTPTDQ